MVYVGAMYLLMVLFGVGSFWPLQDGSFRFG